MKNHKRQFKFWLQPAYNEIQNIFINFWRMIHAEIRYFDSHYCRIKASSVITISIIMMPGTALESNLKNKSFRFDNDRVNYTTELRSICNVHIICNKRINCHSDINLMTRFYALKLMKSFEIIIKKITIITRCIHWSFNTNSRPSFQWLNLLLINHYSLRTTATPSFPGRLHCSYTMDIDEPHTYTPPKHYYQTSSFDDNEINDDGTAKSPLDRGPYFDISASRNVTALVGNTAYLNCRVRNLGNRTVSSSPGRGHEGIGMI